MKFTKYLLHAALLILMLCGCQDDRPPNHNDFNADDTESWELCPFYGELRFLVLHQETGEPIPGVTLNVSTLRIEEQTGGKSISSEHDGLIIIHQLDRGITYWGEGPPQPTFTFSAPDYQTRTYSVDELVAGTSYDPYNGAGLPTTTFLYGTDAEEIQVPVYEFTIHLTPNL
jgi:hypothetical protein